MLPHGDRAQACHTAMRQEGGGSAGSKAPPAPPQAPSLFPSASHLLTCPRGAGVSPLGHRVGVDSFLRHLPLEEAKGQSKAGPAWLQSGNLLLQPELALRNISFCTQSQIPQPPSPALFLETHTQRVPRYTTAANKQAVRRSPHGRGRSHLRAWSTWRAWRPRGTRRTLKQQTKRA